MSFIKRTRAQREDGPGIVATARFARHDAELAQLRRGDIAVISVADIDADAAQDLVDRGVVAVLNAEPSATGRFPNTGPRVIIDAGVALVDSIGPALFDTLRNGDRLRIDGDAVYLGDDVVATGIAMTPERADALREAGSSGLAVRVESIVTNAADRLQRDRLMLLEGAKVPKLQTPMAGRPVVVVQDAHDVNDDLAVLKPFIQDHDPVIIAVGSATRITRRGHLTADIVIGAPDEINVEQLHKNTEIVVVEPNGTLPSPERFEQHRKQPVVFEAIGASEDLALLLADTLEADVIVLAGAPPTLVDMIDRDSADLGNSFIARLRAGTKIVDAKAVKYFRKNRISWLAPLFLLACGMIAVAVAVAATPIGQDWFAPVTSLLDDIWTWIEGLFS